MLTPTDTRLVEIAAAVDALRRRQRREAVWTVAGSVLTLVAILIAQPVLAAERSRHLISSEVAAWLLLIVGICGFVLVMAPRRREPADPHDEPYGDVPGEPL